VGKANAMLPPKTGDPLPVMDNAFAVRDTLARLIADVHAGKLQPKVAADLAPLLNLRLRTIETVTELEKQAADANLRQCKIYRNTIYLS